MKQAEKTPAKPYNETNGCSQKLSCGQVFALIFFLAIETVHLVLIRVIVDMDIIIAYVMMGLAFLSLVFVAIDYVYLICFDPADPRLADPDLAKEGEELQLCVECDRNVLKNSYHCRACQRCVEGFDHHCVFLNNCIGKRNYSSFFRLLMTIILHTTLLITIALIVVVERSGYERWLALGMAVMSLLVLLEVSVLAIFHCYISFVLYQSTLEYLRGSSAKVSPAPEEGVAAEQSAMGMARG